jgi:RecA/RadA recombinase
MEIVKENDVENIEETTEEIQEEETSEEVLNDIQSDSDEIGLSKEEQENILAQVTLDKQKILEDEKKATHETQTTVSQNSKKNIKNSKDSSEIEIQNIMEELNSFMETQIDIKPDVKIKQFIPTGITLLDAILGGGFAVGAMAMIVGQSGGGKSMLSGKVVGQGQLLFLDDFLSGYLDSEQSMTITRLANLGVTKPKIKPYSDMTVEKIFRFIEGLCLFKEKKGIVDVPSIVVWDSIVNTLSASQMEAEDPAKVLGKRAAILSLLIPRYIGKLAKYNICFLTVNQYRDYIQINKFDVKRDLKMMDPSKKIPGGNTLIFNTNQLLEVDTKRVLDIDSNTPTSNKYGFNGLIVKMRCIKNKQFQPNIPIEAVCSFNRGFSNFWTNYRLLKQTGRMNTGAWNYLKTLPEQKFRLKEARNLYYENDTFKSHFDELVEKAIQKDVIEKYSGF